MKTLFFTFTACILLAAPGVVYAEDLSCANDNACIQQSQADRPDEYSDEEQAPVESYDSEVDAGHVLAGARDFCRQKIANREKVPAHCEEDLKDD
jgi:hypothetical protein